MKRPGFDTTGSTGAARQALRPVAMPLASSRPARRARAGWLAGGGFTVVAMLALLILILYPLLAILIQSVVPGLFSVPARFDVTLAPFSRAFSNPEIYHAMLNTAWLGVAVAASGTLTGALLAVLFQRTDLPGKRLFEGLVWVTLFTPSYLVALAWELLFSRGGFIDTTIAPLPDGFINTTFSPVGLTVLLALRMFPFSYLAVVAALRGLGSEYEEAARMVGAHPLRCWLRINGPLLAPALFAGALIIFAESISDYGTAATIAQQAGFNLVTYELYAGLNNAPVDYALAAALAMILVTAIAAVLLLQARLLRARSYQIITGRTRRAHVRRLEGWRWPLALLTGLFFFLALGLPLIATVGVSFMRNVGDGLTRNNLSLTNYQQALDLSGDMLGGLERSTVLALLAATVTAFLGPAIAFIVERTHVRGRGALRLLTIVTLAIPGIVLAAGYIFAWNQPWMNNLPGGTPYPSLGLLLAEGALAQVGDHLLEAARLAGAHTGRLFRHIVLPLIITSVLSTWMLVFTGTIFELPASELLQPAGQAPLAVQIINQYNNFKEGPGTAMTILALLIVTLLALLT
ncbi:MAG TPA: ABC transporter permease subunit, partial [Chloroflexota bacterium]|nr:ABC transporter permease subunit [Chloroflexota bacterium]